VSYIGRRADRPSLACLYGFLYVAGQTLAYLGLAAVLISAATLEQRVAYVLQKYFNQALGPLLIVVGVFMLELIELPGGGGGLSEKWQRRLDDLGIWGAGLLGFVFALSFCPTTAILYFGTLLPTALRAGSAVVVPLVYALSAALPVAFFAVLVAFAAGRVGSAFHRLQAVARWARWLTGTVFVVAGVYYCLIYIYAVQS